MRVVLATNNEHKLAEVGALFAGSGLDVVGLDSFPGLGEAPEMGDSFEANALEKARWVFARTGLATVADDSGIEVAALGWGPGVRSKRFMPEATAASNNARMLRELDGVTDRRARFRCAIALVTERGTATASGVVEGTIGHEPLGEGGFGYDPLFWPDELPGRTLAQVSMEEKNRISHRARAFRQLPRLLAELG